jgi:hypothetical protein
VFILKEKHKKIYAKNQSSKKTKKTKLLNGWGTKFINQKRKILIKAYGNERGEVEVQT